MIVRPFLCAGGGTAVRKNETLNETWFKITDDPATLPPLEEPVFVCFSDSAAILILTRSEIVEDEMANWAWATPVGLHYRPDKNAWAAWDTEWDDDYNPTHWHPFPKNPPDGS